MYVLLYSLGLLTGLVLAGLFFGWRHRRRPRADVHLRIKRGQSPQEMVSGMVKALSEVDSEVVGLRRAKEKAEREAERVMTDLDHWKKEAGVWKARHDAASKLWWLQLKQKKDD